MPAQRWLGQRDARLFFVLASELMGLGTLTESSSNEDLDAGRVQPSLRQRGHHLLSAKETRAAAAESGRIHISPHGSPASAKNKLSPKKGVRRSPSGKAQMASYRETKDFLIAKGLKAREILDAPDIFHLRNYAMSMGIDLSPLEAKYNSALDSLQEATAAAEAATLSAKKAAAEARRAEELAAAEEDQLLTSAVESAVSGMIRSASASMSNVFQGGLGSASPSNQLAGTMPPPPPDGMPQAADAVPPPPGGKPQASMLPLDFAPLPPSEPQPREGTSRPKRGDKEAHEMDVLLAAARAQVARERGAAVAREESNLARVRRAPSKAVLDARAAATEAERVAAAAVAAQQAAEATFADAEYELMYAHAIEFIQARARVFLQRQVYRWAWKSVVAMQKMHRSKGVRALYTRVIAYTRLLKKGALFLKFSSSGSPHDRFVWLDDNLHTLHWCHPDKAEQRVVSAKNSFSLKELVRVTEGAVTKTFKSSAVRRSWPGASASMGGQHQTLQLKLVPSIKKDFHQIFHPSDAFSRVHNANVPVDECSCFSLVFKKRTLDLVAADNRTRDDWMWALRMLRVHWNANETDLGDVHVQRKMMGVDEQFVESHRLSAVDLLGDAYVTLKVDVPRSANGMGLVMDASTNQVLKVDVGSVAEEAGLYSADVISIVDETPVTVIQDGFIYTRSTVPAAVNPLKEVVTFTIFRRYYEDDEDDDLDYDPADPADYPPSELTSELTPSEPVTIEDDTPT